MKSLKNTLKLMPVMLLLVLAGCKKKDSMPTPDGENPDGNKGISASELVDYYIVAEHKTGGNKLLVVYFSQEGNTVKANAHLQGSLRINEVKMGSSKFSIDYNADGKSVYTFTVAKDADGKLKLNAYDFIYNGAGDQLSYATLVKKTEAVAFANSSFKTGDILFKFTGTDLQWDVRLRKSGEIQIPGGQPIVKYDTLPEVTLPYYGITNIAFKTNADEFMGVIVPGWKNINTPVMLVERSDAVFVATRQ